MAKEITLQLTLAIPGCSIMYAPTIELARWILSRRSIQLVVSSPILPDGRISRLKSTLRMLQSPPDVMVVSDGSAQAIDFADDSTYTFAVARRFPGSAGGASGPTPRPASPHHDVSEASGASRELNRRLKELGADIRNDLNNPLQEIVAMVFVAQATGAASESTTQALEAINKAATNMATVVRGLEEKIVQAVKK